MPPHNSSSHKELHDSSQLSTKDSEANSVIIKKLLYVCIVCILFMTAEVIGGILADSIAIISDALHLLSDLSGFAISILSVWISSKTPQSGFTFGYYRAGVIGAFINIMVIWGLTGVLIYEAIWRIIHIDEIEVDGFVMFWTSVIGLVCNLVMAKVLHSHPGHGHHNCSHGHDHSQGHSSKYRDSDEELIVVEAKPIDIAKKKLVDSSEDFSISTTDGVKTSSDPRQFLDSGKSTPESERKLEGSHSHNDEDHEHEHHKEHEHKHSEKCNHKHDHEHHHEEHDHHQHNHQDQNHEDDHNHKEHNHDHNEHKHHDHDGKKCNHDHKHHSHHSHHSHHDSHEHKHHRLEDEHSHDHEHDHSHDHNDHSDNLNIRAAFIHILGDILQSIGVIIASLIIWHNPTGTKIADPICTLIFSVIVFFTTVKITRDIIIILMEGIPKNFNLHEFERKLRLVHGVTGLSNLRVWNLNNEKVCMVVKLKSSDPEETLKIAKKFCKNYNIFESTIEVERA